MESLTISQLAHAARVHIETVRYSQRRGLLEEPPRPERGIRRYGSADVARLRFIRRAQAMGFSLEEVGALLALKGREACDETLQLTRGKLEEVRRKVRELRRIEAELVGLVAGCMRASKNGCPTLDFLDLPSEAAAPPGAEIRSAKQVERVRSASPQFSPSRRTGHRDIRAAEHSCTDAV